LCPGKCGLALTRPQHAHTHTISTPTTHQARSGAGGKGEGSGAEQAEEVVVLHSKAEMNSMISSRFDSSAEAGGGPKRAGSLRKASSSAKLLAAPTKLVRAVSGLRGARVLVFGAEFLNGAHLVRYFLKVRPSSLPPSSSGFGRLFGLDGYACCLLLF